MLATCVVQLTGMPRSGLEIPGCRKAGRGKEGIVVPAADIPGGSIPAWGRRDLSRCLYEMWASRSRWER